MSGYSPKYPLSFEASDGYYGLNKTLEETIRQNVRTLVLTNPGERIMDTEYGVGVQRFLFEFPNIIVGDLSVEIAYQFRKYLPQVALVDVDVLTAEDNPDIDPNAIYLRIEYGVPALNIFDELIIEESLD
jgi:phage baseplate assembly protein W